MSTQMNAKTVSKERWLSFPLTMRMGHIGSEVCRALSRRKSADGEGEKNSIARSLELIDLTLEDEKLGARKKELQILRGVLTDLDEQEEIAPRISQYLQDYFNSFAMLHTLQAQRP